MPILSMFLYFLLSMIYVYVGTVYWFKDTHGASKSGNIPLSDKIPDLLRLALAPGFRHEILALVLVEISASKTDFCFGPREHCRKLLIPETMLYSISSVSS